MGWDPIPYFAVDWNPTYPRQRWILFSHNIVQDKAFTDPTGLIKLSFHVCAAAFEFYDITRNLCTLHTPTERTVLSVLAENQDNNLSQEDIKHGV